jgi:regulator of protease activity HflC (stomatin/prohibitin superfamily)
MTTHDPYLSAYAAQMRPRRHVLPWFTIVVPEYACGALYRHGRLAEQLTAGLHRRFGLGWSATTIDLRRRELVIAGQELLTADHNTVKVSMWLAFTVTDTRRLLSVSMAPEQALHYAAQLALRELVGGWTLDEFFARKGEGDAILLAALVPLADELGYTVNKAAIRDVMLPAELKRAYAAVIAAREEGKAALERARGEHAALRSLANAARLLEEHPALVQLKSLQAITDAAARGGSTIVLGEGVLPLGGMAKGGRHAT